jgi:YebC/PmpR family DNA-binding regulatory protein
MSGHNKWTQIKRQKEKTDAKKSQLFSRLGKLIAIEAKKSPKADSPGLLSAIEKARAANMPNDNIERAISKARGAGSESLESIIYEAYGPGGTAILIEALTSNRNKAAQEIKHILSKHSISLAAPGSASWAFKKGADGYNAETTIELSDDDIVLLEKLVDELEANEEVQNVFTNAD